MRAPTALLALSGVFLFLGVVWPYIEVYTKRTVDGCPYFQDSGTKRVPMEADNGGPVAANIAETLAEMHRGLADNTDRTGAEAADIDVEDLIELTEPELARFNGRDTSLPIYVAIRDAVYDVSSGAKFYGPGGSYSSFAGRVGTRAFALSSLKEEDLRSDLSGLTKEQLDNLGTWESLFAKKYRKVGRLVASE